MVLVSDFFVSSVRERIPRGLPPPPPPPPPRPPLLQRVPGVPVSLLRASPPLFLSPSPDAEAEVAGVVAASASAVAEKSENADRVVEFSNIVASLSSGALIRLPDASGELQDCKLAVRIAAADKMIFVDANGMKAGDYTVQQLVSLLVAGEAELGDQGIEFEDTLAAVVTKLRSDREKSYDDLTGA